MNKSKSIKIRVTEDEYNLIVLKARTEKVNLSEYIRQSAINRRIALPALDIAENQRVTCRPFDEEETYTGIVKADINGRLYIENSKDKSIFYPSCNFTYFSMAVVWCILWNYTNAWK